MTNKVKTLVITSVASFAILAWAIPATVRWMLFTNEALAYARYQNPAYDRKALAINPNDSMAYEGLGDNEILRRNDLGALVLFRKAWQLDPNNHEDATELALDYQQLHRYDEAAQVDMILANYNDSWGDAARSALKKYEAYRQRRTLGPNQSGT